MVIYGSEVPFIIYSVRIFKFVQELFVGDNILNQTVSTNSSELNEIWVVVSSIISFLDLFDDLDTMSCAIFLLRC